MEHATHTPDTQRQEPSVAELVQQVSDLDPAFFFQDRFFDRLQTHPRRCRDRQAHVVDLETDRAAARPPQSELAKLASQQQAARPAAIAVAVRRERIRVIRWRL